MKTALALLCVYLLAGCSTIPGVTMSDAERRACEAQGCTVWTDAELNNLAKDFFLKGYQAGKRAL